MTIGAIRDAVEETGLPEGEQTTVGRVNAIREHGKAVFMDIIDNESKIQLHFRYDIVGEESWNFFRKYIERGDFIGVKGPVFHTRRGELSIEVKDYKILSKALYDPPVEWFGVKDVETRYRQRYLDLMMNSEVRHIFRRRTRIVQKVREFLDNRDFLEVETPVIQEYYGGATARPFTTHVNYLDETRYMQISPERMHADVADIYERQQDIQYDSEFIEGEKDCLKYMKEEVFEDWQAQNVTSIL